MSFFDLFSTDQHNNTGSPYSGDIFFNPGTGVSPTPVTRQLNTIIHSGSPSAINDINHVTQVWHLEMNTGTSASCEYDLNYYYSNFAGNPPHADFSQIATISITQTNVGPQLSLDMELRDSGLGDLIVTGTTNPTTRITTWNMSSFIGVNLSSIYNLSIFTTITAASNVTAEFNNFTSTLVCVAKDTKILMSDQSLRFIQDVQRGEIVSGDTQCSITHQVARVNHQSLTLTHPTNLLTFDMHCLGLDQPNKPLIVTENHPIVYQNARRPAYCFKELPGVTYHQKIPVGQVLPHDDDDSSSSCTVYDLQFDHDGTYVANGVVVQSRSPYSQLTPLPRELYFDQSLCTDERVSDAYDHVLPLDCSILTTI